MEVYRTADRLKHIVATINAPNSLGGAYSGLTNHRNKQVAGNGRGRLHLRRPHETLLANHHNARICRYCVHLLQRQHVGRGVIVGGHICLYHAGTRPDVACLVAAEGHLAVGPNQYLDVG